MKQVDFATSAERLARNPLGVIALFLMLVYGIAGLLLGLTASALSPTERQPLVWFLVLFPTLVLFMFSWLVVRHHPKLYGPSDFPDSESFFRALTYGEQRQKVDAEVSAVKTGMAEQPPLASRTTERRRDLRVTVILAEELAFRELETEFRSPVSRHVRLNNGMLIDGLVRGRGGSTAIEIRYTRTAAEATALVDRAAIQAKQIASAATSGTLRLLFVLVIDGSTSEDSEHIAALLRQRSSALQRELETRVYDFAELQRRHGIEVE